MWIQFALAFLVSLFVVYFSGIVFLKLLKFDTGFSVLFAPIASTCVFSFLPIVYGFIGAACTVTSVVIVPTAILLLLLFFQNKNLLTQKTSVVISLEKQDWLILCLYILIGVLLCFAFFIEPLDSPNSFFNRVDNSTHINMVQSFLDSGIWSSLITTNYPIAESSPIASTGSFYPSSWHCLVAIVSQITAASIPVSINAVNAMFISVIYPTSIFLLLKALFKKDKQVLVAGSIVALAFTAFPWGLFLKGPLYPNLASFCLLPIVLGTFILFLEKAVYKENLTKFILIAIISIISLTLMQTNSIFSCLVFFACFLASWLYKRASISKLLNNKLLAPICVIVVSVLIWLAFFTLPFMQNVVTYEHESNLSFKDALFYIISLALSASIPQLFLAALIPFGIIFLLTKKNIWILFPAIFMAIAFLECRWGSGALKHLIAGFWYTDYYRIAANLAIFLVPIGSAGLRFIIGIFQAITDDVFKTMHIEPTKTVIPTTIILLFALLNYFPNYTYPRSDQIIETPFGLIHQRMESIFSNKTEQVYSLNEQQFVNKVLDAIPNDALVINQPNDGSLFAYGVNNLNTYYRFIIRGDSIPSNETSDSEIIRTKLNEYQNNKEVQKAVSNIGAQYVLLLDANKSWEDMPKLPQSSKPDNWVGIDSINDLTPGFEIVLEQDDMRLYKIQNVGD